MTPVPEPAARKPLRLWPGVVLLIVQWFFWFVLQRLMPDQVMVASIGGIIAGALVVLWWLFFSRAPWLDRLGAVVLMFAAVAATRPFLDKSVQTAIDGMLFTFFVIPCLTLALVAGAAAGRRLSAGPRRAVMAAAILLGAGLWTTVRTDAISVGQMPLAWRWTATAEERLLAQAASDPLPPPPSATPAAATLPGARSPGASAPGDNAGAGSRDTTVTRSSPALSEPGITRVEWPGFRGALRDGAARGTRINTDWSASPPVEIWRRPIGPGWSSFAVSGDLFYTQEQRGEEEIVACYRMSTGKPVWAHRDRIRFWEANAGAGPRATPTLGHGRVYALGATGMLNALDAATGVVLWSRNAASDTGAELPIWGFAGSPLVVDDAVVVSAAGTLASYDAATGKPRWVGPKHGGNYSSPQLFTIDGVEQIVLLSPPGAIGVAPADGAQLWEHAWEGGAIVQPALTADGDLLIGALSGPGGLGIRRLAVKRAAGAWTVTERWTSNGLKPYFNDFVVHNGHAFGFDGSILSCVDVADGKRKWKGGRYGDGQLILLPDQNLLLVLTEDGGLVLVSAISDQFKEVARFPAIEGMTWNHPVLVGDILLVRNAGEMAAFRLATAGRQ